MHLFAAILRPFSPGRKNLNRWDLSSAYMPLKFYPDPSRFAGVIREKLIFQGKRGGPLESIGTFRLELCKNGWTDQDAIWDARSRGPRNRVLDGGADISTRRDTFRGVYGPLQSIRFWGTGKTVSCTKTVGPTLTIYTSHDVSKQGGAVWGSR